MSVNLAELLRRRVESDPSSPLLTFYDDANGERVELSARTFDNWVAKTANLVTQGLGAEPGTRVVLALPPHWQSMVWLMACWSAGLVAEPVEIDGSGETGPFDGPYLLVAAEEVLDQVTANQDADEIVGLSLHALGGPLRDCPPGVEDYAVEVRAYADRFDAPGPVPPNTPALHVTKTTLSHQDLSERAHAAATEWGLDAQERILVNLPRITLDAVLLSLLAPLASGASAIIQRNLNEDLVERRVRVERVTKVAGLSEWNDASGSVHRLV
jgi:uncharacterized protein (TIGR03089 family)